MKVQIFFNVSLKFIVLNNRNIGDWDLSQIWIFLELTILVKKFSTAAEYRSRNSETRQNIDSSAIGIA